MTEDIIKQLQNRLKGIEQLYNQLLLLIGVAGSGKTSILKKVAKKFSAPLINLNLELSRLMLELPEKQRALQVAELVDKIIKDTGEDKVILDNIEILFAEELHLDPLRLLKHLSRDKTLIVSWPGYCQDGYLMYAEPQHVEYHRYKLEGETTINLNQSPE